MSNKTPAEPVDATASVHRSKNKWFLVATSVLLGVSVGLFLLASSKNDKNSEHFLSVKTPTTRIRAEIADTQAEREKGLSNRRELPSDNGMLFIFEPGEARCFWMKDTYIPLDMVWLNDDKQVVYAYENATPESLTPICPTESATYVLEVVAGRASELGLNVGATVDF